MGGRGSPLGICGKTGGPAGLLRRSGRGDSKNHRRCLRGRGRGADRLLGNRQTGFPPGGFRPCLDGTAVLGFCRRGRGMVGMDQRRGGKYAFIPAFRRQRLRRLYLPCRDPLRPRLPGCRLPGRRLRQPGLRRQGLYRGGLCLFLSGAFFFCGFGHRVFGFFHGIGAAGSGDALSRARGCLCFPGQGR